MPKKRAKKARKRLVWVSRSIFKKVVAFGKKHGANVRKLKKTPSRVRRKKKAARK